ncbi:MAG: rhodanese [Methylococcaceae bacterium]|nr:rhodanese [Methylococcaceae bacterium]
MAVKQISALALQKYLNDGETPLLLDVREPQEFEIAHIKGSVLIPLNQVSQQLDHLDKAQEIIVVCHHGVRSQNAANYMDYSGFTNTVNLTGGIDAWAIDCDKAMPRY